MPNSSLAAIKEKVRRLTRSPSTQLLTDAVLEEYINTFIVYDFPEHIRLFNLKTTFSFFTEPNIDTYLPTAPAPNPLNNFNQTYISFEGPVYIAGFEAALSQSRSEFYRLYPIINSVVDTQLRGNNVLLAFAGTLPAVPVLRNQVTFTTVDANNNALTLYDAAGLGLLISPDGISNGTINYLTGAYTLNFAVAPGNNAVIWSETVPYVAARPQMILFYDNSFTVRPVPDKAYKVTMDAYIRPTDLLANNESPQLQEWWQYIAYGAAKKMFEDRMDLESVQMIMPEFKKQEELILRRTIVQLSNQRVATIYTQQNQAGWGFNPYGGPF